MSPTTASPAVTAAAVSLPARMLHDLLVSLSAKRGYCWASQAILAASLGRSERSVRNYLAELVAAGLITVERDDRLKNNRYRPEAGCRPTGKICRPTGSRLPPDRQNLPPILLLLLIEN